MALWIQSRPPEKCGLGELQVAEQLAALPDDWIIRWGFYYEDNAGIAREGDFLVLGPDGGLLVLEAKGGNLEYNPYTGKWNTADGDNPQYQLEGEWGGVLRTVKNHPVDRPSLFVGRALALPGLSLPATDKDYHGINRQWIFDAGNLRDFTKTWNERMHLWGARLDPRSRDTFFETFGKDAVPKAVRHFVDETDRLLIRQTEAGYELLDALSANRQFLVQGGTGSGKTWLAFEQACRWAESGSGERVLFLCYNLALTGLLSEMVARAKARKRLRRGEIIVRSWEDLSRNLINGAGLSYDVPEDLADRTRFYDQELPQILAQVVREGHCKPEFDCLVVDEAQDHNTSIPGFPADWAGPGWWGVYWALLKSGSKSRIAAFFDAAQRPTFRGGGGFDAATLLKAAEYKPVQVKLTRTVRYTRTLFQFLKGLQSNALVELNNGLRQRGSLPEGPEVILCDAVPTEVAAAAEKILNKWFEQGWCRPEQVLVLSRHSQMKNSALKDCQSLAGKPLVNHLDRRADEIGLLSVNRAKGLDSLAVILIDYGPFQTLSDSDQVGFFMGASRARLLLGVVTSITTSSIRCLGCSGSITLVTRKCFSLFLGFTAVHLLNLSFLGLIWLREVEGIVITCSYNFTETILSKLNCKRRMAGVGVSTTDRLRNPSAAFQKQLCTD